MPVETRSSVDGQPAEFRHAACPICHLGISLQADRVICPRGHRFRLFDRLVDFYVAQDGDSDVLKANIDYYAQTADVYDSVIAAAEIFNPFAQSRIDELVATMAQNTSADLLVDVGCGTGNVLNVASRHFKECVGFDISAQMLLFSARRGFTVHRAKGERLPLKSSCADAVTGYSFLHHMIEPNSFLQEAHRVLKPGGYLYTDNDPNFRSARPLKKSLLYSTMLKVNRFIGRGRQQVLELRHVDEEIHGLAEYHHLRGTGFKADDLRRALEEAGFREVSIIPHGNAGGLSAKNTPLNCPRDHQAIMVALALVMALHGRLWSYRRDAPLLLCFARK